VIAENLLMLKQKTPLLRRTRRDMIVKLPTLQSRPVTQQPILRKRLPVR
jgi:hypothetical protein